VIKNSLPERVSVNVKLKADEVKIKLWSSFSDAADRIRMMQEFLL